MVPVAELVNAPDTGPAERDKAGECWFESNQAPQLGGIKNGR